MDNWYYSRIQRDVTRCQECIVMSGRSHSGAAPITVHFQEERQRSTIPLSCAMHKKVASVFSIRTELCRKEKNFLNFKEYEHIFLWINLKDGPVSEVTDVHD